MIVNAVKTDVIEPGATDLFAVLDKHLPNLAENTILAVTSKIISICEGSFVPLDEIDKDSLIVKQSQYYIPAEHTKYNNNLTITKNTFISAAGIDESNSHGNYILWPKDPQASANALRRYLKDKFTLTNVGVVITDSTSVPFRLGTTGTYLAYSGFKPLNDYIGKPDLFGKSFEVSQANVASALAASAVGEMGEGTEQTPLAIIEDASFVTFVDADPSPEELESMKLTLETDLYESIWKNVPWQQGEQL